jgi:hypothetical protein
MSEGSVPTHLRPFFPAAADFAAATGPHFRFLVDDFGYTGPELVDHAGLSFDVRFDGPQAAVLLNWDVEGGYFACNLIRRLGNGDLDPDFDRWLSPNEILAARGAREKWVTHDDLERVNKQGYARVMERQAANLRDYCADVLRGNWSIYKAAHSWFEEHPDV